MQRLNIIILSLLIVLANCTSPKPIGDLESDIRSILEAADGRFAVVFEDLSQPNVRIAINEFDRFHAASTMKTPVMVELWRQADAGELSLDDSVLVKNSFFSIVDSSTYEMDISRDGGDQLYAAIGEYRTVRELTYDMITLSSNLATNILIELADAQKVTAMMRSIGADTIQVLRGVEDMKAFDAGLNNTTNAHDLAVLFRHLYDMGSASTEMIDILKAQHYKDVIGSGLPDSISVASKSGSITNTVHDSGIVYLPDGRAYIMVFLSSNLNGNDTGIQVGKDISRTLYEYLTD